MAKEKAEKNTCILYGDIIEYIEGDDALSDSQVAELFRVYLAYANGKDIKISDPEVKGVWRAIKVRVDKANANYAEKCEQLRENIKKRYKSNQKNTNEYKCNNDIDIDIDSDSDSESDIDNVSISPTGEKEKVDSYESTEKKAAQSSEEVTVEDAMIGLGFSPDLEAALKDWCGYKAERHEKYKPLGLKSLITQVTNNARQYGDIAVVRAIRDSMASGYKGIVFDKLRASPSGDLSHDEFVDRWRNV